MRMRLLTEGKLPMQLHGSCCGAGRYLIETPANICKPAYLAAAAARVAESAPEVLKLEVMEEGECEKMGMGLFLGVAECSEAPAKLIHLTYTPPGIICGPLGNAESYTCSCWVCLLVWQTSSTTQDTLIIHCSRAMVFATVIATIC